MKMIQRINSFPSFSWQINEQESGAFDDDDHFSGNWSSGRGWSKSYAIDNWSLSWKEGCRWSGSWLDGWGV